MAVKRWIKWIGVDAAIMPLVLGRSWSIVAAPLTPFCIGIFLSQEQQGLFYLFGSILAIQGMFELGFGQVLMQHFSHDAPKCGWIAGSLQQTSDEAVCRVRIYLRVGLVWYTLLAVIILGAVGPLGLGFIQATSGAPEMTAGPWWVLVGASVATTLVQPFVLLINGFNYVAFVNTVRTIALATQNLILCLALFFGAGLYSSGIAATWGFACLLVPCVIWHRRLISFALVGTRLKAVGGTIHRLFLLQAKTAMAFVCGYAIFQLFVPILAKVDSTVSAGQFGMTQALLGAAASLPLAWTQTKLPAVGNLLGNGDFRGAEALYRVAFLRMVILSVPAIAGGAVMLQVMQWFVFENSRIVGPASLALLCVGFALQNVSISISSYIRAHKVEPFIFMSWVLAIVAVVATAGLASWFGTIGACISFVLCWAIAVVWGVVIFRRGSSRW